MLSSVAKIPYESAIGGVLNNVTISPEQLEVIN
jgi:pyruvate-formate lyase